MDIDGVTAVEWIANVLPVQLRLEPVGRGRLWRALLLDREQRLCLERVRDRAGRRVAEVGERAGAPGRVLWCVVFREMGRPCRCLGDRVGRAGIRMDVERFATVERVAVRVAVQLD